MAFVKLLRRSNYETEKHEIADSKPFSGIISSDTLLDPPEPDCFAHAG
jgi:hypothetical protein